MKGPPSRSEENSTLLRDETGAEVCPTKETKYTEIYGIVTALKEIEKCLPRSQAQHQYGNCTDWLVLRTVYQQTAPYLEEIDNIVRLKKNIVGAAAEATKTLFFNENSYQEITDFLKQRYGAPDVLVIAETN
ncbi:hypothetical protein EVAR_33512_1 [Eumeta japonica]|uniref:Uncharacterized protein n=1 Tax=Eumeta variegata TaxID=151549 RepID=A0A4C1VLL0_EUMVA|nr:hypothetical protein EVAR_33512_1 [Eumeta japonica]